MSSVSGSVVWGIRWETIERKDGIPVYGGMIEERFETRRRARRALRQLSRTFPVRCNPFNATICHPVRHILFARGPDQIFGL